MRYEQKYPSSELVEKQCGSMHVSKIEQRKQKSHLW